MATASPFSSLSPRYDHSALGSIPDGAAMPDLSEVMAEMKRYGSLVAVHGVLAFLAFQVFMPLAVVFAAVGKTSFPDSWLKWHARTQMFIVTPLTVVAITLAGVSAATRPALIPSGISRHGKMGFTLLGLVVVQLALGWYSHFAQERKERFSAENGLPEPAPKRRLANWAHLAVGVTLLTLGGLQVTWGFGEFEGRLGQPVPVWIEVIHYVIAGVPVLIVTPFVLVRGIMRMRDGQSFIEAFLSRPAPSNKVHPPPRKLFLGSSSYIDETYGPSGIVYDEDAEKDGVGHEYAKGFSRIDNRARVESTASSWPGHETREEYEADLASQQSHGGSVVGSLASWDYARFGNEENSSLLHAAAPMGHSTASTRRPSSQPPRAASPAPTSYPPSSTPVSLPPPSLPPVSPVYHPTSPTPSTLAATVAASVALPPPPPAPPSSALSPRLTFMPFPGEAAVVPPPASASPAYEPTLSPSSTRSSRPNLASLAVRDQPEGEGKAPSPATLVPSPPPPAPAAAAPAKNTGFVSAAALRRQQTAASASTSVAAVCEGEQGAATASATEAGVSPTVQRHTSLQGKIEGPPAAEKEASIKEEKEEFEAPSKVEGEEKTSADAAKADLPERLPSPSFPDSDSEDGEEEHDPDVPLTRDDSESTRLMDELERELTISTMRSGRSWATTAIEGGEDGEADGASEAVSDEGKTVESGHWLGGKEK
ncbi:hypothetical protein JCM6882_005421 [Rhodosporidiobolus microsporus]